MDKLMSAENILERQEKRGLRIGLSDADYVVATGRGRKRKAHIPDGEGLPLCRTRFNKLKSVGAETVERFYDKCEECQKEKEG